jgi:hypothetical protein
LHGLDAFVGNDVLVPVGIFVNALVNLLVGLRSEPANTAQADIARWATAVTTREFQFVEGAGSYPRAFFEPLSSEQR